MKKLPLLIAVLGSVLMLLGCEKAEEVDDISLLKKEWAQSYEEKSVDDIEIYRPSDYMEFPFSWYRQIFHFADDNLCHYSVLAPNDAHYMATGSWEYNEQTNIIEVFSSDSELLYELEIVDLKADLLKVRVHH